MISAVVHTYNEEKNLERCLASLTFADEIVLIDMGSTDKTVTIAQNFTKRIYQHPYTGFVEPARNFGIAKARGDWILVIDADEVVPSRLKTIIKEIAASSATNDFYALARKNFVFAKWLKHSGWWPDYQIRLFKKGKVNWSEAIHGVPITVGQGREIEAREETALIHYHYQSIEQYLERLNRYTSVQAKQLYLKNFRADLELFFKKPLAEFVKRFFREEGYKDGVHGLILSLLQSVSELAVVLKLWELNGGQEQNIQLKKYKELVQKDERVKKYWLYNELIKKKGNVLEEIWWRIQRKINS